MPDYSAALAAYLEAHQPDLEAAMRRGLDDFVASPHGVGMPQTELIDLATMEAAVVPVARNAWMRTLSAWFLDRAVEMGWTDDPL